MKISIVPAGDYHSNYGGGQVYVRRLVAELERQGHEVVIGFDPTADVVHAHGHKAETVLKAKALGIPCVVTAHHGGILCPAGTLLNTKDEICHTKACHRNCLPCYLKTIRTGLLWHPIVRHCKPSHYVAFGRWLSKLPFIPFLTPIGQAALSIEGKLKGWQTVAEHATLVLAPSQAIADSMMLNGLEASKIKVIPHGVPVVEDASIQHPNPQFYYVGRITRVKGIHVMLKAFDQLKESSAQLHLVGGAGTKSERRYLRGLQRKYRGNKRIVWEGKINDPKELEQLVETFDCLVHPAIYLEVFGLNIGEALMQGKWVIATRCGGAEMQIREGENGNLLEPNNVEAIRTAMQAYLAHPKQPTGAKPISLEEHVNQLVEIYQSLL